MSSSSRQSRREAARRREQVARRPAWLLPALAVAAVVVIGGLALALSGNQPTDSSARPSASAGSSGAIGAAPTITGLSLAPFENADGDIAVGQPAPTVVGSSFDDSAVSIGGNGRPQMLLFLAHWCSFCQAEVTAVQAWLDTGGLPDGVDLVSVSTSAEPARPNYPPDEWLRREGWTPPVMVDPTGSVATAFGLAAFPYFVFVNADGTVAGRITGEVPVEDLEAIAIELAAGT